MPGPHLQQLSIGALPSHAVPTACRHPAWAGRTACPRRTWRPTWRRPMGARPTVCRPQARPPRATGACCPARLQSRLCAAACPYTQLVQPACGRACCGLRLHFCAQQECPACLKPAHLGARTVPLSSFPVPTTYSCFCRPGMPPPGAPGGGPLFPAAGGPPQPGGALFPAAANASSAAAPGSDAPAAAAKPAPAAAAPAVDGLVWTDDECSQEERRAQLAKYSAAAKPADAAPGAAAAAPAGAHAHGAAPPRGGPPGQPSMVRGTTCCLLD